MSRDHIYWDADPFLAWLQEEAGKVDLCQGTIGEAVPDSAPFIVGTGHRLDGVMHYA